MLPLLKKQTQKPTPTSYILQVASLSLSLSLSRPYEKITQLCACFTTTSNCSQVLQAPTFANPI